MFDYILLDLDGTLTNPAEGIGKSINYALEKMGKPLIPDEMIPKFIGPPLRDGYMQNLGFTAEEAEQAINFYRERYIPTGLYENVLIDGAVELIQRLRAAGKTIALATSKPEDMAITLLKHFELFDYFDFISGAALNAAGRHSKTDIIAHALAHSSVNTPEKLAKTVMVGDRFHDIEGAKNTGIKSIAVLSGFGSREEFEAHKADYIAVGLLDACSLILGA
jgi:phosphoglycolate phosphatase